MKNRLLLLLAFQVFTAVLVPAQESPTPLYLWETTNGEARIFLAGSIHMLSEDFYPLPARMLRAAEESDYLVLEADISGADPEELSLLALEHGMYLDGTTLEDHIPRKLYLRVQERVRELGLPEEQMMLMKPWLLGTGLSTASEALIGLDPELGMEYFFTGSYPDLKVLELEGMVYQLELLASPDEKDQILLLESALTEADTAGEEIQDMLRAWKNGDDAGLEEILSESSGLGRSLNRRLITERNARMVRRILEFTGNSDSTYLVLVGTAHYLGDQNLPSLLAGEGLRVERIYSDGSAVPVP